MIVCTVLFMMNSKCIHTKLRKQVQPLKSVAVLNLHPHYFVVLVFLSYEAGYFKF